MGKRRMRKRCEAAFKARVALAAIRGDKTLSEPASVHRLHATQGTRSLAGRAWSERTWTTIATCAQPGKRAFDFLSHSVQALLSNTPPPTLLPAA